ncbi:MAG: hypothetical protein K6E63_05470, partial [Lachnospiraceae bacterium]|nr:hypothetical protein [Lachnospiraceae bacterium]
MGYIMYVCPGCRSYFKTGGADKKIKCPKCHNEYLLSLKISDEKWRELDKGTRQARINRALAGEQLRDETPPKEESPVIPADAPIKKPDHLSDSEDLFKPEAPDEAILEARRLLEQKDVQAEMPALQLDYKKFNIVIIAALVLLFIPCIFNILVPAITIKKELTAIVQAKPGDTVKFGRHKGNTSWRVLEVEEDRALIICDHPVKT